jgi:Uma2 family endonuclease
MTTEHNDVMDMLYSQLRRQLDEREWAIGTNSRKLLIPNGNFRIPDLCVMPRAMVRKLRATPGTFEVYEPPVPLVVEVWSPSTGAYDIEQKLREYQERHDAEIWYIHPYERTLTAWRRQPEGAYAERVYREGTVDPAAIPGVTIDIDRLFD